MFKKFSELEVGDEFQSGGEIWQKLDRGVLFAAEPDRKEAPNARTSRAGIDHHRYFNDCTLVELEINRLKTERTVIPFPVRKNNRART